jgi:hypothetical protein
MAWITPGIGEGIVLELRIRLTLDIKPLYCFAAHPIRRVFIKDHSRSVGDILGGPNIACHRSLIWA